MTASIQFAIVVFINQALTSATHTSLSAGWNDHKGKQYRAL